MPQVSIINGGHAYEQMFLHYGWDVVREFERDSDLVQFTGGEDVSPVFYAEPPHKRTHSSLERDFAEIKVFSFALANGIPMAGICRGGQFLNVMCGGRMWQDVDGHIGPHRVVWEQRGNFPVLASSTHHQMMRMHPDKGRLVLWAHKSPEWHGATYKEDGWHHAQAADVDVEGLYYKEQKALCFQPHPEYMGFPALTALYFDMIEHYLGLASNG